MEQAKVIVDKLVGAIRMAEYNGVDIKDLADKLEDGVLSADEQEQMVNDLDWFLVRRDLPLVSIVRQARVAGVVNMTPEELIANLDELTENQRTVVRAKFHYEGDVKSAKSGINRAANALKNNPDEAGLENLKVAKQRLEEVQGA